LVLGRRSLRGAGVAKRRARRELDLHQPVVPPRPNQARPIAALANDDAMHKLFRNACWAGSRQRIVVPRWAKEACGKRTMRRGRPTPSGKGFHQPTFLWRTREEWGGGAAMSGRLIAKSHLSVAGAFPWQG